MARGLIPLAATLIVGLATAPASASPGDRDPSFGVGGIGDLPYSYTPAIAAQPDGAIISANPSTGYTGPTVARTSTTGQLDSSFGANGQIPLPLGMSKNAQIVRVATSPSGAIAAVGSTIPEFPSADGYVARLKPDGTPDTAFGSQGAALLDLGGSETLNGVAFTQGGALVVTGVINKYSASPSSVIARLHPDGTLDSSFGGGSGYLTDVDGDSSTADEIRALITLADGRIEVLSTVSEGPPSYTLRPRVTMLEPDGGLDKGFANDGVADVSLGTTTAAQGIARSASGETYMFGGRYANGGVTGLVARLTPSGALDSNFANSGVLELPMSFTTAVVDGSDRLVIVGATGEASDPGHLPPPTDVVLLRLAPDGLPDASFGDNGAIRTDVGQFDSSDFPTAAVVDSQGRVVVAGELSDAGFHSSSRLIRYLPDAGPDDLDGDGVLDDADGCIQRYGAGSPDGCPTWRALGLDIEYARKIDDFAGSISFGQATKCADGAIVNVLRVRKGRDRRVGRPQAAELVSDSTQPQPQYRWSVSALARPGRYYARITPRSIDAFGHCDTLRSEKLRIRHRR